MTTAGFFNKVCKCGCGQFVHGGDYLPGHEGNNFNGAGGKVLCGNNLEVLKGLENDSVDCVVTSPPYYGLREYDGDYATDWPEISFVPMAGLPSIAIPAMSCCHGLEKDIWAYVGHEVQIFREVKRVLAPHGVLFLNLGDSYAANRGSGNKGIGKKQATNKGANLGKLVCPANLKSKDLLGIPWRVAFALQADGWYLRQDVIWNKPSTMPESVRDRCTKSHEYVFMLAKSMQYYYDQKAIAEKSKSTPHAAGYKSGEDYAVGPMNRGGKSQREGDQTRVWGSPDRNKRSVWNISTEGSKEAHFAVMPQKLARICILAGSPKEVCPKCGKPRTRLLDKHRKATRPGKNVKADYAALKAKNKELSFGNRDPQRHVTETKTVGWTDCGCGKKSRPGVVLDPFGGTGTTGVVAAQLGRQYILIEMSEKYAGIIRKRLQRYNR